MATPGESPQSAPLPAIDELSRLGLFGALSHDALGFLGRRLHMSHVEPGTMLCEEGQPGTDLFVLLEGELEVLKASARGAQTRIALLGPGDWIGEMSIVDIQPRSASVRATAPSRLMRLSSRDLDALYRHDLKAYSMLVLNLARELSRRLRVADSILADVTASVLSHSRLSR